MALYAISDLHLSLNADKPMDVFSDRWKNHDQKIKESWNSMIGEDDTVLIAGDISWAMKLDEAITDLNYIHDLNGNKVFIKGNHDYWWTSVSRLNNMYDDMFFLQNISYKYENYAICGTRGWISLEAGEVHDEKIYTRELLRLEMSLKDARKQGAENIIVMMHYPPVTRISRNNEFIDLIKQYNVEKLIYGHIHYDAREICIQGDYNGTQYICTSCDIIDFKPVRIL